MNLSRHPLVPFLALILGILVCPSPADAQVLPFSLPTLKIEKVFDNAAELGDLAQSPTGELWVLERAGTIKVYRLGAIDATLTIPVSTSCESGLLDVAFDPDYRRTGIALVSYVDPGGQLKIDQVIRSESGLSNGGTIINVGNTAGGCNPGGGLLVGTDGKLYVGVGDLESSGNAQNDASFAGKILRSNLNGTVPPDNLSGTLVWAKGLRNAKDLALNPNTTRAGGTLYVSDLGTDSGSGVFDEVNAPAESDNLGWDAHDGPGGGPAYVDPIVAYDPTIQPEALEAFPTDALGAMHQDSVTYACVAADEIREAVLTGDEKDGLDSTRAFFDPDNDRDGTPDIDCPRQMNTLTVTDEGWLYAGNDGSNPGIWRVWRDDPGPREVSAAGSPFPLTVEKNGDNLTIGWEQLGDLDVGRPEPNGGQHAADYQIWEGPLPVPAGWGIADLNSVATTNGTLEPGVQGYLTTTVNPSTGSHFYIVAAQGDNMEVLGTAGDGSPRPVVDYCDDVGWGITVGSCAQGWTHPVTGAPGYGLIDYNPHSETFMQTITLADLRGRVVRMDISATNCFWCGVQADFFHDLDLKYRDRDVSIVTVMMDTYGYWDALPSSQCAAEIEAWANTNNETGPILCDTDLDADGRADVAWSYYQDCGTPTNYYIKPGHTIYDFVCGAETSSALIENRILLGGPNDETCE